MYVPLTTTVQYLGALQMFSRNFDVSFSNNKKTIHKDAAISFPRLTLNVSSSYDNSVIYKMRHMFSPNVDVRFSNNKRTI